MAVSPKETGVLALLVYSRAKSFSDDALSVQQHSIKKAAYGLLQRPFRGQSLHTLSVDYIGAGCIQVCPQRLHMELLEWLVNACICAILADQASQPTLHSQTIREARFELLLPAHPYRSPSVLLAWLCRAGQFSKFCKVCQRRSMAPCLSPASAAVSHGNSKPPKAGRLKRPL